jgi:transcriptional regulator
MYVPAKFALADEALWDVVRDAGAGSLVVATPDGLVSVFLPVVISDDRRSLRTHVARANPWWRAISDDAEVLAIFIAASAYVSPSMYPSRFDSPGVVPTWNYVAAEVRGRIHVHDDPAWTARQVRSQTENFESSRSPQWSVDDAPQDYVALQLKAIVGISIDVISVEGKAKLSQNRPQVDHDSVRENLRDGGWTERNVADRMGE